MYSSVLTACILLQSSIADTEAPGERRSESVSQEITAMADIDYQMYSVLNQIPAAISAARAAVSGSTQDTNRDKAITGAACLLGAISGGLGVTHGIDLATASVSTTQAALLGWLAQHSWGYGYWGPFLLDLQDTEPGCGLEDFNRLVGEYSFVTNLYSTYGHDLRTFYLQEFGRKLKLELHCLTSQAGSSSEAAALVGLIDKFVILGTERLQITAEFM